MALPACSGQIKVRSSSIDKDAYFVHINLDIRVLNKDSIMATVSFRNDSSGKYCIYRPLLPSDQPGSSLFCVSDNKGNTVRYKGDRRGKVLDGHNNLVTLIPDMNAVNFLTLAPRDSVDFTCNLAHQYDFQPFLDKGIRDFRVIYLAKNPVVEDDKQIFALDTVDHSRKPVYDFLESNPVPPPDFGWRYITFP